MKTKRHYYVIQAYWGASRKEILKFDSYAARKEYLETHDYCNSITVAEIEWLNKLSPYGY